MRAKQPNQLRQHQLHVAAILGRRATRQRAFAENQSLRRFSILVNAIEVTEPTPPTLATRRSVSAQSTPQRLLKRRSALDEYRPFTEQNRVEVSMTHA